MKDMLASSVRDARIMILNMKISITAALDDPNADVDKLNDAYEKLNDAYDALSDVSEILDD